MSIDELTAVVAPPERPTEAGDAVAWEKVQADLGTALPEDFRDFGLRYGTGSFHDGKRIAVRPLNPFSVLFSGGVPGWRLCT